MLKERKFFRLLVTGVAAGVFTTAFVVFAGAPEGPVQLEEGENPVELPQPQEQEVDNSIDLPEPKEHPERPEPISPVDEPREAGFACPECGTGYKLDLQEIERPEDDSGNEGNPIRQDANPVDPPEPVEDETGDGEFTIEFPDPEETEGEPVDLMDIEEDEPVKPAFACPGCDSKYELELLKVEEPELPELPEPEDPIEIPEPDDNDEEEEFEFDIDDLLD